MTVPKKFEFVTELAMPQEDYQSAPKSAPLGCTKYDDIYNKAQNDIKKLKELLKLLLYTETDIWLYHSGIIQLSSRP